MPQRRRCGDASSLYPLRASLKRAHKALRGWKGEERENLEPAFILKTLHFHHQNIKGHEAGNNLCPQQCPGFNHPGIDCPQYQPQRIENIHSQRNAFCGLGAADFNHLGQKSQGGQKSRDYAQRIDKIHEGCFPCFSEKLFFNCSAHAFPSSPPQRSHAIYPAEGLSSLPKF